MARTVTLNGASFSIPEPGETGYDAALTSYLVALSTAFPQLGGTWALTSDLDFGAAFGLKTAYLKSRSANPASAGLVRAAVADLIAWRNNANSADLSLGVDAGDKLKFNGNNVTGMPFAAYTSSLAQSGTTTPATYQFNTIEADTDSAVTTGSGWKFTCPAGKGGRYSVTAAVMWGGGTAGGLISLLKNGSIVRKVGYVSAITSGDTMFLQSIITLSPADTLSIQVSQSSGGSVAFSTDPLANYIQIQGLVS